MLVMGLDNGLRVTCYLGRISGKTTANATNHRTLRVEVEVDHRRQIPIETEMHQSLGRLGCGAARLFRVAARSQNLCRGQCRKIHRLTQTPHFATLLVDGH